MKLPDSIVNELVSKLEALTKKYETTFAEVEAQISETENTLSAMIDELEGNEFDMLGLSEFKKCWEVCKMTEKLQNLSLGSQDLMTLGNSVS